MESSKNKPTTLIAGPIMVCAAMHGTCPVCATKHDVSAEHNHQSLLFIVRYWQKYGHFPENEHGGPE